MVYLNSRGWQADLVSGEVEFSHFLGLETLRELMDH